MPKKGCSSSRFISQFWETQSTKAGPRSVKPSHPSTKETQVSKVAALTIHVPLPVTALHWHTALKATTDLRQQHKRIRTSPCLLGPDRQGGRAPSINPEQTALWHLCLQLMCIAKNEEEAGWQPLKCLLSESTKRALIQSEVKNFCFGS